MTEVSLEFIAQQIERVLAEQRHMRNQIAGIHDQLTMLPGIRDELTLQREQLRIHSSAIARLNDTITMDILDRLRTLETRDAR
jgi:hypothetical protein